MNSHDQEKTRVTRSARQAVIDETAAPAPRVPAAPTPETAAEPGLFDLETLRSELTVGAFFADGTRNGEMVDLAHFTRNRIARALREADLRLGESIDRETRTDAVVEAVPHGPSCKPWRAKHYPDDPAICVCWKGEYARAKAGPPATS